MRPFAGITAQRYWQNGYSETGAGTASLHYDDMTRNSVVSRLGTAVEFDTVLYGARVLPAVSLGWAHSFSDRSAKMDAAFASAPNGRFTTRSADMSRNALELGLSAELIGKDDGLSVGRLWRQFRQRRPGSQLWPARQAEAISRAGRISTGPAVAGDFRRQPYLFDFAPVCRPKVLRVMPR